MVELSDIKDEITKAWNTAKKESDFNFRAICTKYAGGINVDIHIQEAIVNFKDYRDNGGLGNLYINTYPKPNFFDDSKIAPYDIGILSNDNLNLISNYYYNNHVYDSSSNETVKNTLYVCCYGFFVRLQTVKRLSDLLDEIKRKKEDMKHIQPNTFSKVMDKSKLLALRKLLIDKQYIVESTTEDIFLYWFGFESTPEYIRPINWVNATLKDINSFVNVFYSNESKKWEKAVRAFTRNGRSINQKSLSTALEKYDTDPEGKKLFENFRKNP